MSAGPTTRTRRSTSRTTGRPDGSTSSLARGRASGAKRELPAIVGEGLVGLRHAVDVVLALPGAPLLLRGVVDLVGEAFGHRLLAPPARELDQPADGEGAGPAGLNLDGHLVGGPADAARADLEHRGQRLDRLV